MRYIHLLHADFDLREGTASKITSGKGGGGEEEGAWVQSELLNFKAIWLPFSMRVSKLCQKYQTARKRTLESF